MLRVKGALTPSASEPMASALLLLIVTVCAAAVCPTPTVAKLSCAGVPAIPVPTCPLPFKGIDTGVTPDVEDETTSVAPMGPVAAGVNTICTVQLLAALNVTPHVVAAIE